MSDSATEVSRSALLPYGAEQLFELVNDIESYPQFLDGCESAEIISRSADCIEARLHINKKGIRQSFATRNKLFANERVVMELIDGPFESFVGEWKLVELQDQGCRLSLDLEFVMGGSLLMRLAAPFFGDMGNRLVDAVVDEAARRFG